jgi:hypothetical protein
VGSFIPDQARDQKNCLPEQILSGGFICTDWGRTLQMTGECLDPQLPRIPH